MRTRNVLRHTVSISAVFVMMFAFSAHADFLQDAKAIVEASTASGAPWSGPTTGPKAQAGKHIIYIASDMKNGGVLGVKDGVEEAVKVIGWKLDVLDGAGSVKDQVAALNQAIAKKPDGIVVGGWNPNVAKIPLKKASKQGIVLVGWHALPDPGPIEKYDIFYNVTSDSQDVAKVAAMYAVAQSNGKAKALIFTDSLYQIALDKANAMKAVIEQCAECEVVEFIDTPLADTSNRMPPLTFTLLQKYGDDFQYSLAINDLYFDFMNSSLKTAGKDPNGAPFNISAGDGSVSAYQRIRQGNYQTATVPEPLTLHGWQVVDEFNRAFAGQKPSGYITPVHLVTKENIAFDGGPNNVYDPDNGYREEYKKIWGVK
ncbi:sugar ABC transporter substrate-binding protein [candidate division KSB3 bacterium]|uniref:Sugar ABC transporter substrate-binding protein n=1 Tax=candidate division KSB3 bacterium TaxID=2044937 RepID=A0A2G6E890_9BACT|nr:MAG: sugar ABC transporter substrate-binding protein [candidate division KSB3 bacterium]PIE30443.1 MAG: sugar ABC transporter substrate-binding protein [candidate division KSB3 bacterium]